MENRITLEAELMPEIRMSSIFNLRISENHNYASLLYYYFIDVYEWKSGSRQDRIVMYEREDVAREQYKKPDCCPLMHVY